MELIRPPKDWQLWRVQWHGLFAAIIVIGATAAVVGISVSLINHGESSVQWLRFAKLILLLAVLTGSFAALLLLYEAVNSLKDNNEKLDNVAEMLNRNRYLLAQIAQGIRLSDASKEIAFRDNDRMELAEAVLGKLHLHDFEAAGAMIDALAGRPEYKTLAEQLKKSFETYRNATEEDRINQIIAHIDRLCSKFLWSQAAAQIENLITTFPYSEKAKTTPRILQEKKDARKGELLAAWDYAVKAKETDRSLEILKELDMYLTPTEALALQESASTVFRTKLHNLGVQFSLAVAEKNWSEALLTGKKIVNDFPNSRMAQEIRGKMDILHEKARQVKG